VFEIYERLLELKQGDKSVPEFYGELKGLIEELEMHQPAITDAATLRNIVRVSQYQNFYLESCTMIAGAGSDTGRR